jgi:hypothetical protein
MNKNGRAMGNTSLAHSLRINAPKGNVLHLNELEKISHSDSHYLPEWNEELTQNNLIALPDGNIVALDSLSDEQKHSLKERLLGPEKGRADESRRKVKSHAKNKLNKWVSDGALLGKAAEFIVQILSREDTIDICQALNTFESFDMTRKDQRVKQLFNYLETHNKLIPVPRTRNATKFQEVLFKIPAVNNISAEQVSHLDMMGALKQFISSHYPDYPIEMMILHDDERLTNENHVGHVHAYISGMNSVTGNYDLRVAQIKRINVYLRENGQSDECLNESGRMTKKQSSKITYHMQRMFNDYINKHLFEPCGLRAEFNDKTQIDNERLARMKKESKKSKSSREFQFATQVIEKAKEAEVTLLKTQQMQSIADEQLASTKRKLAKIESRLIIVDENIAQREGMLAQIEGRERKVASIMFSLLEGLASRTFFRAQKQPELTKKFFTPIVYKFTEYLPAFLQPAFKRLVEVLEDTELANKLKEKSHEKLNKKDDDLSM